MIIAEDSLVLLKEKEVATLLKISGSGLRRLRRSKEKNLKFIRIGKAIRYQLSDIKKFIEESKNGY